MLLSKAQIEGRGIIEGSADENFRPAGYDLTAGQIIDVNGREFKGDEYEIAPQGIVWVISREIVRLGPTTLGYATIKTGLCNQGALALNIGIVDPGWRGPLSTSFVNFGKVPIRIRKGQAFLRLTFHSFSGNVEAPILTVEKAQYVQNVKFSALQNFGNSFLNISDYLARHQRHAFYKNLGWYGVIFTATLGLFSIILFLVGEIYDLRDSDFAQNNSMIERVATEYIEREEGGYAGRVQRQERYIRRLELRIDQLAAQIEAANEPQGAISENAAGEGMSEGDDN
ncbi:dCTP deaminase domain-containing protein [Henriciella marina]|uniref:dUTPase-like domain-containing protein n=1 Tax=Henriciella marina TaxID=453851 RepID=A0ABT4LVH1_9PROT|nr:hypothetical protein [Henriciella marina]MCZ4298365.1 hypothetical protein [Henriciella marina]